MLYITQQNSTAHNIASLTHAHDKRKDKTMTNKPTQRDRVIQYIRENGSITRAESFSELGIVELPARICELERMGYAFKRERVTKKNRYGDDVSFLKYSLAER